MRKLELYWVASNFCDENPITVIDMVKKIYNLIGRKPDYKILNQAKYEIKHQYLYSRKAREILNWRPEYTLDYGLNKAIKWYENKKY